MPKLFSAEEQAEKLRLLGDCYTKYRDELFGKWGKTPRSLRKSAVWIAHVKKDPVGATAHTDLLKQIDTLYSAITRKANDAGKSEAKELLQSAVHAWVPALAVSEASVAEASVALASVAAASVAASAAAAASVAASGCTCSYSL